MKYRAEITAREQLSEALAIDVFERVYVPMEFLNANTFNKREKYRIIAVPPVFLGGNEPVIARELRNLKQAGFESALAHTLGHIKLIKNAGLTPHGGFRLNITNSLSLKQYEDSGLTDATFSVEMPLKRMNKIKRNIYTGMMAFGKLPLMLLRRCPVRDGKPCGDSGCNALTDRLGNKLITLCRYGEVEILNPAPLVLGDKINDITADFCTLRFTNEKIAEVLRLYGQGLPYEGKFTRGLYYKGVR
ncbi:MAG: hypothetical protein LBC82_06170 [Oscillospiraceae bacterium]|jgi:putative protease|nr:hypothetical protein [Oscillospiraceae bacterium]